MVTFNSSQILCSGHLATLIDFTIPNGILDPASLGSITLPDVPAHLGVVISGRGPIWLYCYIIHRYHPTRWVGVYDPRLGIVVVMTHHPQSPKIGSVLVMNTIPSK